ncbi:hypothetical protein [Geminocystis sp. GBBB08]|uniref:hypothetical protein n=1 Tax=Geminocystis sp. GBBB08 TaxID=2604140 RepID=UPI0027E342E7|nr:hypothetical protein [Geminocystis sp. GBBB08]MBL1208266.1 hypothetical protein [Geminocystis sp. GBBB08]
MSKKFSWLAQISDWSNTASNLINNIVPITNLFRKDVKKPEIPDKSSTVNITVNCPDNPPNIINYTVRNIINNTNLNVYLTKSVVVPSPPIRILPISTKVSGSSTNTTYTYTSDVKSSLLNHKFGRMLCNILYKEAVEFNDADNRTVSAFKDELMGDLGALDADIDAEYDKENPAPALLEALAFVSLTNLGQPVLIGATKNIHKIGNYYSARASNIENFNVTGLISIGELIFKSDGVTPPSSNEPPLITEYELDECVIPVSAFDEMKGYKTNQLQIMYRNLDWGKGNYYRKYFTLPSPIDIDSITQDSFSILSNFTFGATLIEIWIRINNVQDAVRAVQKTQIYTNFQTKDECKEFIEGDFATWLTSLCQDVKIQQWIPTFLDEPIWVGECRPYRAVYMGWESDKRHWKKKAAWLIKKP